MIAVDTNILVHAHRSNSPWHEAARSAVASLAQSDMAWAIPWPCIHEFLSVVSNPKIMKPATPIDRGLAQIEAWMESAKLVLLAEGANHWASLKQFVLSGGISGAQFHDARIAAICVQHGVMELWTADRDFSRFPALKTRNPLVG